MSEIQLNPGNPAKTKGWSKSGTLKTDGPGVTAHPSQNRVQTQATEFGEAEQFTVQFFVSRANVSGTNVSQRAKATITWSVAGNSVQRVISLYDGASISGVGEAVRVVVEDDSFRVGPATPNDVKEYQVSFQFAPGTRPSQQQPPYLFIYKPVGFVNVPGFTLLIPENIGAISTNVYLSGLLAGVTATATMVSGAAGLSWDVLNDDPNQVWRPIMPGCTAIAFAFSIPSRPQVGLMVGIDG
jgi:hypothetical protein